MILPSLAPPARRRFLAACVAAPCLFTSASHGQVGQVPNPSSGVATNQQQQNPAPINPEALSCNALKARLQTTGELNILVGPRGGWGDTFYGPAVPRCQFWQMPVFSYVRTSDGVCGVGYICVEKLSFD